MTRHVEEHMFKITEQRDSYPLITKRTSVCILRMLANKKWFGAVLHGKLFSSNLSNSFGGKPCLAKLHSGYGSLNHLPPRLMIGELSLYSNRIPMASFLTPVQRGVQTCPAEEGAGETSGPDEGMSSACSWAGPSNLR